MNLATTLLYAYGTSEGVKKEWDTRGRGKKSVKELMPHAQELAAFWKKKIMEVDPKAVMSKSQAYVYKSGFGPRNAKPESAAVWMSGQSSKGEQFGLDLRLLPEESGTALHIGDSWLPKSWQGHGLYSAGVGHLIEKKHELGLNGNMYVHNSMNDPPWEHIAKKYGLKWVNH